MLKWSKCTVQMYLLGSIFFVFKLYYHLSKYKRCWFYYLFGQMLHFYTLKRQADSNTELK